MIIHTMEQLRISFTLLLRLCESRRDEHIITNIRISSERRWAWSLTPTHAAHFPTLDSIFVHVCIVITDVWELYLAKISRKREKWKGLKVYACQRIFDWLEIVENFVFVWFANYVQFSLNNTDNELDSMPIFSQRYRIFVIMCSQFHLNHTLTQQLTHLSLL